MLSLASCDSKPTQPDDGKAQDANIAASGDKQATAADKGQEISCTCGGKTVKKTCKGDGYCDCSGEEPKVVCCDSTCKLPEPSVPVEVDASQVEAATDKEGCTRCSISCSGDGWTNSCSGGGCKTCITAQCSENNCVAGCASPC